MNQYILKHHRPGAGYSLLRKISFYIRALRTNYGRRALHGALMLREAGIETLQPVAYWNAWRLGLRRESFFIYEKVHAQSTLAELLRTLERSGDPQAEQSRRELLLALVELARKLHRHNLSHGDIAMHNILVQRGLLAGHDHRLVLLDTDHVGQRRFSLGRFWKILFDLRCLRRLELEPTQKKEFLRLYLGEDYREHWWHVLCFWKWWGARPFRRVRHVKLSRLETA